MSDIDFPSLIEPVARHFWGEPPKGLIAGIGMRFGSQGSKSIVFKTGEWYDHEAHEGGGVLALIIREVEHVSTEADAVRWLEDNGFIGKDPATAPQPHQESRDESPAPEVPPEDDRPLQGSAEGGREVEVERYDYTDAAGAFQYRVIRFHEVNADGSPVLGKSGNPKKTFRQKSRDASGNIVWGLNGRAVCLYRWPQVQLAVEEHKTVHIVEGEKDVHTLEAWGLVATTNSGGAQNWRPEFAETFRGADVVILVDNDDVGIAAGEAKAMSLRGIAARIRVLNFADHVSGFPQKGDVTDWKDRFGGTAEQFAQIVQSVQDWRPAPPKSCFGAMTIDEAVRVGRRAHSWLVQDLVELRGTCSFAGFTQSGKSFAMIKLGFSIALGQQFFGHDVMQGLVVYQVGEGATGFMKRVEGYCQDAGIEDRSDIPLVILPSKINLFVDDKDTDALIAECKAWEAYWHARSGQKLRALIIDTFNKATRGANEISGQDMGKINDRVERIARELDCTVIVVDHLSAQGRLRGHTSKTDDMANTVKVEITGKEDNNGRKIRRMVFEKVKDGENGVSIPFVLRSINIGLDDMGHPVTTCVVDSPDGEIAEEMAKGAVSVGPALLLRIIKDTAEIHGTAAPPELVQVPPGRNVAKWEDVKAAVRKQWSITATDPKGIEAEVKRIVGQYGNRLKLAGYIDRDNDRGLIWWTGKEDRVRKPDAKPVEKPAPSPLMTAADFEVPF